jgi:hypothetical protein
VFLMLFFVGSLMSLCGLVALCGLGFFVDSFFLPFELCFIFFKQKKKINFTSSFLLFLFLFDIFLYLIFFIHHPSCLKLLLYFLLFSFFFYSNFIQSINRVTFFPWSIAFIPNPLQNFLFFFFRLHNLGLDSLFSLSLGF